MSAPRRSRRSFLQFLGLNGLAASAGACTTASSGSANRVGARLAPGRAAALDGLIRLDSNENAHGPGPRVLARIQEAFGEINRYPFGTSRDLVAAIARYVGAQPEQV